MIKKKILFVLYSLNIGGVERAFLGLLSKLDLSQVDITLKLARKEGSLLKELPDCIRVEEIADIKTNWDLLTVPLLYQLRNTTLIKDKIDLLKSYLQYKINGHYHKIFKRIFKENDTTLYDLAISYAGPSSMLDYYVIHNTTAKKKIAWVHFDIEKFAINYNSQKLLYPSFDKIFVVSERGKEIFDKRFPSESSKSQVFQNVIDSQYIHAQSLNDSVEFEKNIINIVTVGRLSYEKGQDIAVDVLVKLKEWGFNVKWTLVGGGTIENVIKEKAYESGVSDCIDITGVCHNPYSYMAKCDLYVQPSVHEGFCITIAEAKIFGMPIVATDFTGAQEQLNNYQNGIVVKRTVQDLAFALKRLIEHKSYEDKYPVEPTNNDIEQFNQLLNSTMR